MLQLVNRMCRLPSSTLPVYQLQNKILFSSLMQLFFKFCYLLTPMRMDNARILMVPQISLSSDVVSSQPYPGSLTVVEEWEGQCPQLSLLPSLLGGEVTLS